ncbi:MAG: Rrf2 family transcriptional regulator [Fibromonadaceae bacterium]|jgi:Rrf2 family protein|nr:Rrf2 family transcriptional regulator [Fibromonadaceae bacterium]
MRISAKGRYALAVMVQMAENYGYGADIAVVNISKNLGISKIYLEQIFSLLKKNGLLNSVKGTKGGYHLSRRPKLITATDILYAVENSLFEETKGSASDKAPEVDKSIRLLVFDELNKKIKETLDSITLEALCDEAEKHKVDGKDMFYI